LKVILNIGVLLNLDFAVESMMRISNAKQVSISGYFLAYEIVSYFEVKKIFLKTLL